MNDVEEGGKTIKISRSESAALRSSKILSSNDDGAFCTLLSGWWWLGGVVGWLLEERAHTYGRPE